MSETKKAPLRSFDSMKTEITASSGQNVTVQTSKQLQNADAYATREELTSKEGTGPVKSVSAGESLGLTDHITTSTGVIDDEVEVIIGDGGDMFLLSEEEAKAPLGVPFVRVGEDDEDYATYSVEEAATQLNISPAIVLGWIKHGKLVGLELGKRGWRIPKIQIRGKQIAPGLDLIKDYFVDSEDQWHYLVTPQLIEGKSTRPIDLHFQNKLDFAIGLAEGMGTDFM